MDLQKHNNKNKTELHCRGFLLLFSLSLFFATGFSRSDRDGEDAGGWGVRGKQSKQLERHLQQSVFTVSVNHTAWLPPSGGFVYLLRIINPI